MSKNILFDFKIFIYNNKNNLMKKLKKDEDRRIRISISMSPELYKMIEENTTNKSKYVEFGMLEYFSKCGIDTSKIKI